MAGTMNINQPENWRDEREGDDRVVFVWGRTYYRSLVLGSLMALFVFTTFFVQLVQFEWSWTLVLLIVIPVAAIAFRSIRQLKRKYPKCSQGIYFVVMDRPSRESSLPIEDAVSADQIDFICLRENTGRRKADDERLWQVYLKMKASTSLKLIYQEPGWRTRLEKARQMASKLANRWKVRLIDETKFSA